jgi:adenine deaminase
MDTVLRVARGEAPADLVLKDCRVVNVFTGEIEAADVAIHDGLVAGLGRYQGTKEVPMAGRFVAPGLIDTHIHVESTMLTPAELARTIVPRGTTTIIADPHEIANVLGLDGVRYMLEASEGLPMNAWFMAPSCVPATLMETAGAELKAAELETLLGHPRLLGLGEVMNFPGVIHGDPGMLDKLRAFSGRPLDGHAPGVSGQALCAYLATGIGTDHECASVDEAREKLRRGMRLLIREGSEARNLDALLPVIDDANFRRITFCTDDRHPEDLLSQGHLDYLLRRAVAGGLGPVRALTMATLNAAEAFGLKQVGAVAPGWQADLIVLSDLNAMTVDSVYHRGRLVARNGELTAPIRPGPRTDGVSPMNVAPLSLDSFAVPAGGRKIRIIEIIPGQVLTGTSIEEAPVRNGRLASDPDRDLVRMVVVERHHGSGRIGHGLVRGLGLRRGAIASSVAHDSHNIIAAGVDESDLLAAVNRVAEMHGGQVVVADGRVLAELPLPVAGLMSEASVGEVAAGVSRVKNAARDLGSSLHNPLMAMSFMALAVIPHLKLTDGGLVDVDQFRFVPLFAD